MEYQKIEMGRYNLHFIKTDKFKTVDMHVHFRRKNEKENITISSLLIGVLSATSLNYPTRRDMVVALQDLYSCGIGTDFFVSGTCSILGLTFKFINEKYTEKGMNEKSIRFLFDVLFNPNVKDLKFDKDTFDLEISSYREFLECKNDNPRRLALRNLNEIRGKNTTLEYDVAGYLDDLNKITRESLYDFYLSLINESAMDIFVIGDLDIEELKKILNDCILLDDSNKNVPLRKVETTDIIVDSITEKSKFKQSRLSIGYRIDDMTDFERKYVLSVFNFIFGGGDDSLLFKNVREKNSLCYSINSFFNATYDILTVVAGIKSSDAIKTEEIINEQLLKVQNGEFDEEDIETVKTNYLASYKEIMDSPSSILGVYENHEYLDNDLIELRKENIQKVTKDMVIQLSKKVKLGVTYLLEGEE